MTIPFTNDLRELNEGIARFVWPGAKFYTVGNTIHVVRNGVKVYKGKPFTESLDALAQHVWPKTEMDTLWIIRGKDGKLSYAYGYSRGEKNDVVCWSKALSIEDWDCLSPIAATPALACCEAIGKLLEGKK